MVNIANSLMKIAVNILDHRESSKTQQQNILNASVIDIARVQQTLLQVSTSFNVPKLFFRFKFSLHFIRK